MDDYNEIVALELTKLADGDESSLCYLALQPVWRPMPTPAPYELVGAEVLVRVKNGKDAAPMPGLATFQTCKREAAARFAQYQIKWVVPAARANKSMWFSVNVRPDELLGTKSAIIDATANTIVDASGRSNLIFEITEYSPIDEAVQQLMNELSTTHGVQFALDDVNATKEGKGYAAGNHACTFEMG